MRITSSSGSSLSRIGALLRSTHKQHFEHESVLANAYLNQAMAEEVGSAASAGAKAALNSFMNPSINIVKTIPQGIIELLLRGANVVI